MCYMPRTHSYAPLPTVGVREIRQNLSVYLERVLAGEALTITDRGRPVAVLTPLPSGATPMDQLVAAGRATKGNGSLAKFLNEPGVHDDFRRAMQRLDSLMTEFQRNPRKFIKLSIF